MFFMSSLISLNVHSQFKDSLAVVVTTEKYILAFYESKPELLAEVLHSELIKRTIKTLPDSNKILFTNNKIEMVELSKKFNTQGKYDSKSEAKIELLDLFKEMATVKLTAENWIDYIHLVKINGKWQIINVIWLMI